MSHDHGLGGVTTMYDQYYGFSARPFQLTADPAFYFESGTHRRAMSYLGYGLAQGEGFVIITGEVGAGKTTLVNHLMATVDPRRLTAIRLVSTQGGEDMPHLVAGGFGIATEGIEKAEVLARIEAFLHQNARAGKRALLVIDDAQNLSPEALEDISVLSGYQLSGQSLLQIFLLGRPELRDMVNGKGRLEQLRQRTIAVHHLDALQPDEVAAYVEHRLRTVGWTGRPRFTPDGYALLAREIAGIPRRLNALVSRALLLGAIDKLDIIDRRVIEAVIADAGADAQLGDGVEAEPSADHAPSEVAEQALSHLRAAVSDDMSDLQAIRDEVYAFSAVLSGHAAGPVAFADLAARVQTAEERLTAVELRVQEQDEVLRRILAKLIEWVERDDRNGPFVHRAA